MGNSWVELVEWNSFDGVHGAARVEGYGKVGNKVQLPLRGSWTLASALRVDQRKSENCATLNVRSVIWK